MSDVALADVAGGRPKLDHPANPVTAFVFLGLLAGGLFYTAYSLYQDVEAAGAPISTLLPFLLLGVALLIALGFEFVNGFHDTANAVATVIYTHSMPANVAVLWSGFFNFLGVLLSSGAVAYGIISLLPVELILQVGSGAGFAMVFALLIAAIIWNLGTWWLGLPDPITMSGTLTVPPDVKATLPPAPVATPTAPIVARVVEPTLPLAANMKAVTESPEMLSPDLEPTPVAIPTTIRLRGTRLRARRLGQAMPPLDERIKESRSRKIRVRLKTRRKHKPLPKTPRKAPVRQIAAAPNVGNTFISAKATTKIVGAPPKPLRVRLAASP
ncbi:MAG: inorganic phosphate transporter [Hyphomicrobium sp.]